MKTMKTAIAIMLVLAATAGAAAQEPQFAYRILNGYVDKKQVEEGKGQRVGGAVVAAVGGLMIGAAATTWYLGDDIARECSGSPMDAELKLNVSLGLGIGGVLTTGLGAAIMSAKPRDYRAEYAEVFAERDPAIQEALAVAVLRDLAYRGRKERVEGALYNLLAPLVYSAVRAGINVANDREWSDGVMDGLYWNAFSIAGGISSLFGTSEEERLYEKYVAGREALYGISARPGN